MKVLDYDGLDYYNSLIENKYAPKNSPSLTGTPTAPTPTAGDDSTKIATTAYVQAELQDYLDLTGGTINGNLVVTGNITGDLVGDVTGNADTATNATNDGNGDEIATTYLPLSGGTMTGDVTLGDAKFEVTDTTDNVNGYLQAYGWGTLLTVDSDDYVQAGAKITLNSKNQNSVNNGNNLGWFTIEADDGTNKTMLEGTPNGILIWDGSKVLTVAGGTLTGALNTANNTWNNLGDDAAFGDHNVGGKMCVKTQTSTATGIAFFNNSNTNVGQVEVNNAFNFNKAIKQNGIDLTPQTYSIKNTSSDVNVASGSIKNLLSFSITKGTWLVQGVASFPTNSSGYRRLGIATDTSSSYMDRYTVQTTPAASGVPTHLSFTTCLKTSGTTTYYLNAYQTSGSTLAVTAGVLMFRLSNTSS